MKSPSLHHPDHAQTRTFDRRPFSPTRRSKKLYLPVLVVTAFGPMFVRGYPRPAMSTCVCYWPADRVTKKEAA